MKKSKVHLHNNLLYVRRDNKTKKIFLYLESVKRVKINLSKYYQNAYFKSILRVLF